MPDFIATMDIISKLPFYHNSQYCTIEVYIEFDSINHDTINWFGLGFVLLQFSNFLLCASGCGYYLPPKIQIVPSATSSNITIDTMITSTKPYIFYFSIVRTDGPVKIRSNLLISQWLVGPIKQWKLNENSDRWSTKIWKVSQWLLKDSQITIITFSKERTLKALRDL